MSSLSVDGTSRQRVCKARAGSMHQHPIPCAQSCYSKSADQATFCQVGSRGLSQGFLRRFDGSRSGSMNRTFAMCYQSPEIARRHPRHWPKPTETRRWLNHSGVRYKGPVHRVTRHRFVPNCDTALSQIATQLCPGRIHRSFLSPLRHPTFRFRMRSAANSLAGIILH